MTFKKCKYCQVVDVELRQTPEGWKPFKQDGSRHLWEECKEEKKIHQPPQQHQHQRQQHQASTTTTTATGVDNDNNTTASNATSTVALLRTVIEEQRSDFEYVRSRLDKIEAVLDALSTSIATLQQQKQQQQ